MQRILGGENTVTRFAVEPVLASAQVTLVLMESLQSIEQPPTVLAKKCRFVIRRVAFVLLKCCLRRKQPFAVYAFETGLVAGPVALVLLQSFLEGKDRLHGLQSFVR